MPQLQRFASRLLKAAILAGAAMVAGPLQAAEAITVFAAASLQEVLQEAATLYEADTGAPVTLVYAGSGALARQIAAGAPADLFISANRGWADWLQQARPEVFAAGTIAGNQLVAIVPATEVDTWPENPSADLFGPRVAIGLSEAVPAGIYGRQALETLGLWEALAPRLVETENVRMALALVAAGAVSSGIVYRSDALAEPRVAIAHEFPENSHDPIQYPALQLRPQSGAFLNLLLSEEGQALFAKHGFSRASEAANQ